MTGSRTDPAGLPVLDGAQPLVEQPRRAFVEHVMGLPMSVHVRGPLARDAAVEALVADAFAALRADDAMFSTWRADSEVGRIRRGALALADASPRVREVAALCAEAGRRTDGAFSAWLPGPAGGETWPDGAAPDGRPADERRFDPTGLVKGYAVEQAFDALVEGLAALGPHDVLFAAGGDVVVACARTDTPDWTVAVEDPRDRSRVLRTLRLRRGAVATSGTAARGAHILDPTTGAAPAALLSATVVGPDLTWADVHATAAFVRGAAAADALRALPGHAALLVAADGTVTTVP